MGRNYKKDVTNEQLHRLIENRLNEKIIENSSSYWNSIFMLLSI